VEGNLVASQRKKSKLREAIDEDLHPGEEIVSEIFGRVETGDVVDPDVTIVLTNRRVIAFWKKAIKRVVISWSYDQITALACGKRPLRGATLVFTVPGDKFVAYGFEKQAAKDFRHAVVNALAVAGGASVSNSQQRSASERLAQLQSLRDQDLVSDEEFTERRSAILDSV
jgi:preprotein translocase subunit YajC